MSIVAIDEILQPLTNGVFVDIQGSQLHGLDPWSRRSVDVDGLMAQGNNHKQHIYSLGIVRKYDQ